MIIAVFYTRCGDEHNVLFNVFIFHTLDMLKLKNIARNLCEVSLITLPKMHIRNLIENRTPPK